MENERKGYKVPDLKEHGSMEEITLHVHQMHGVGHLKMRKLVGGKGYGLGHCKHHDDDVCGLGTFS